MCGKGLIFLGAIATDIITTGIAHGWSDSSKLSTVLVAIALSTALLGLGLILIGRLHLASVVQYLPMPVIGGVLDTPT
jgi:SulP family sulfate permease